MLLFPELTAYRNNECLVNIISLDLLQAKYHVYFDSAIANSFSVFLSDENILTFESMGHGLYIYRVGSTTPYSFINTVSENKSFYTNKEIKGAEAAREQQGTRVEVNKIKAYSLKKSTTRMVVRPRIL